MKERPILFSGPMVRAILEGRKTQTRRVIRLPHNNPLGAWEPTTAGGGTVKYVGDIPAPEIAAIWHTRTGDCYVCPLGDVGDRLWVRESISSVRHPSDGHIMHHVFAADGARIPRDPQLRPEFDDAMAFAHLARPSGIPSIHMPRWASRITLEITGVRAERLQSIEWDEAIAEGIPDPRRAARRVDPVEGTVAQFRQLWDGLNAARGHGWDANPWVWVVEFRRI
ncbi:hypothetical protein FCJ61_04250 [Burkholderia metallica]|uniref:hypothetical protein n=1 Tax=Burkholderia metallica TaxID=488729 RepID=UPI00157AD276|nr:hypothetical protein [Burkholderia metallica]NTZ82250.1 hypothetical protein [Burkholderia metallica]